MCGDGGDGDGCGGIWGAIVCGEEWGGGCGGWGACSSVIVS